MPLPSYLLPVSNNVFSDITKEIFPTTSRELILRVICTLLRLGDTVAQYYVSLWMKPQGWYGLAGISSC